jgi:hypothetical protein
MASHLAHKRCSGLENGAYGYRVKVQFSHGDLFEAENKITDAMLDARHLFPYGTIPHQKVYKLSAPRHEGSPTPFRFLCIFPGMRRMV